MPSPLAFESPKEFDLWIATYAAMISRNHWRADEDQPGVSAAAADAAVRELRKRMMIFSGKPIPLGAWEANHA